MAILPPWLAGPKPIPERVSEASRKAGSVQLYPCELCAFIHKQPLHVANHAGLPQLLQHRYLVLVFCCSSNSGGVSPKTSFMQLPTLGTGRFGFRCWGSHAIPRHCRRQTRRLGRAASRKWSSSPTEGCCPSLVLHCLRWKHAP